MTSYMKRVFHSNDHQFICLISTIHSNEHNFICMIGVHISIISLINNSYQVFKTLIETFICESPLDSCIHELFMKHELFMIWYKLSGRLWSVIICIAIMDESGYHRPMITDQGSIFFIIPKKNRPSRRPLLIRKGSGIPFPTPPAPTNQYLVNNWSKTCP